jgi:hypothetical protein
MWADSTSVKPPPALKAAVRLAVAVVTLAGHASDCDRSTR